MLKLYIYSSQECTWHTPFNCELPYEEWAFPHGGYQCSSEADGCPGSQLYKKCRNSSDRLAGGRQFPSRFLSITFQCLFPSLRYGTDLPQFTNRFVLWYPIQIRSFSFSLTNIRSIRGWRGSVAKAATTGMTVWFAQRPTTTTLNWKKEIRGLCYLQMTGFYYFTTYCCIQWTFSKINADWNISFLRANKELAIKRDIPSFTIEEYIQNLIGFPELVDKLAKVSDAVEVCTSIQFHDLYQEIYHFQLWIIYKYQMLFQRNNSANLHHPFSANDLNLVRASY